MRDSKLNYVLVGIFVIGMVTALLVSIATLTGRTGDTEPYFAVYGNVGGVTTGTKVLYEGFQVGQVERIEPVRVGSETRFRVWMAVRAGWPIPADSEARIAASGLLAAVALDIRGGTSEVLVEPGQEIRATEGGNLFAVMSDVAHEVTNLSQTALRPLLANLNQQLDIVGDLLRERAPELMANLLSVSEDLAAKTPRITEGMEEFTAGLNDTGSRLGHVLNDRNLATIDASIANVHATTENFAALAADMRQTRQQLDQVLAGLDRVVTGNEESLKVALGDLRTTMGTISRSVGTISRDLEGAARNLNELTREVRRNPSQLLRATPPDDGPQRR